MDYTFTVPGFENVPLTLRTSIFGSPKILCNGVALEKDSTRNFNLALSDGAKLTLRLKPRTLDFVPQILYGGQVLEVTPPLAPYQMVLTYLPLGLISIGGAIGGACGAAAMGINMSIFHGRQSAAIKVILSILTTFCAVLVWLIAAVAFTLLFHHS